MREVIISVSCMGKTKLCKEFRDEAWRQSKSVDLDYKGVTCFSTSVREANSTLAAALLSDGHDIVTGFPGQFDYKQLLADRVNITFALPIGKLLDSLPERSRERKDSRAFTDLLDRERFKIAYHVFTDYLDCMEAWRNLCIQAQEQGAIEYEEISLLRPVLVYSSNRHAYVSDIVTVGECDHLTISIDDVKWHPLGGSSAECNAIRALKALAEGGYYEI